MRVGRFPWCVGPESNVGELQPHFRKFVGKVGRATGMLVFLTSCVAGE